MENSVAIKAASGASSSTLQPRKANKIKRPSPIRMPRSPNTVATSTLFEQNVDVGRGVLSDILAMRGKECVRALASFVL